MSNNKMLIDATHPEETRVVVLRGGRVEEFDYESAARKLLRGNIYLAKVTRVEPSLQAAFVDYGGNRHGFLAFNEIHPDYYQIPFADRQALIDEEARADAEEEAAADARAEAVARRRGGQGGGAQPHRAAASGAAASDTDESEPEEGEADDTEDGDEGEVDLAGNRENTDDGEGEHGNRDDHIGEGDDDAADNERGAISEAGANVGHGDSPGGAREDDDGGEARGAAGTGSLSRAEASGLRDDLLSDGDEATRNVVIDDNGGREPVAQPAADDDERPAEVARGAPAGDENGEGEGGVQEVTGGAETAEVEQVGNEDALEEMTARPRPRRRARSYKIQEVIKRRQVILVQVVKEERGTKGAALTTYLSLAGRYTVLMPNTARGGGISRKISNPQDRKRLKAIAQELEVPEGMGLIIRTAGAARTKQEIKRDFEYLLRLWESVRELTLQSEAPSLVYEEGNLIKRSIRDLYNKDVDEILVAGADAHREAHDFMRMLMPSHAKNVIEYRAPEPLFTRFGIERQLNAMFSPYVTLRSGGYLVINQTEALVAVDVNSGKSTREFSIEETALNTNLEAADEIARQVKLRDLAGLVVIDFIDMEEKRNNRAVERRLKDALRFDRARIQLGRISHFGLMEMSRQRLRTGVLEGSTTQCPHCQGTGIIRSTESVALAVLRGLEDAVMAGARTPLVATTTPTVALYILNNKRSFIIDMEARLGMPIAVQGSEKMQGANFTIEKGAALATHTVRRNDRNAVNMDWGFDGDDEPEIETPHHEDADEAPPVRGADAGRDREDGESRDNGEGRDGGRRRRRRRRRGRRGERFEGDNVRASGEGQDHGDSDGDADGGDDEDGDEDGTSDRIETAGGSGDPDGDDARSSIRDGDADESDDDGDDEGGTASDARPGKGRSGEERNGDDGEPRRRGRRRGRRGGRRNRDRGDAPAGTGTAVIAGFGPQPAIEPAIEPGIEDDGEAGSPRHSAAREPRPGRSGGERRPAWAEPGASEANDSTGDQDRGSDREETGEHPAHPTRDRERPVADRRSGSDARPAADGGTEEASAPQAATETAGPKPTGASGAVSEPEVPRHRQRSLLEPGEPKIERVVVRADEAATTTAPAETDKPARKGWWSRRFGGE